MPRPARPWGWASGRGRPNPSGCGAPRGVARLDSSMTWATLGLLVVVETRHDPGERGAATRHRPHPDDARRRKRDPGRSRARHAWSTHPVTSAAAHVTGESGHNAASHRFPPTATVASATRRVKGCDT